jgi:hypothetical protein
MTYINNQTGHRYTGGSMTRLVGGVLFSGVPTVEQLTEWGYHPLVANQEQHVPTQEEIRQQRMVEILSLLAETDYIVLKKAEGIDISEYDAKYVGGFLAWRQALRAEYNDLEQQESKWL